MNKSTAAVDTSPMHDPSTRLSRALFDLGPCSATCSSAQAIYKSYQPDGHMTLQSFIIIFGVVQLLLSQMPNIHALRGLNLLSTIATLSFATVATVLNIVSGKNMDRSTVTHELEGDNQLVLFSAFAALGTIAFRSAARLDTIQQGPSHVTNSPEWGCYIQDATCF